MIIASSNNAHIVRYQSGHIAIAEQLTDDEWQVRVFLNTIGSSPLVPEDGSTLTFVTDNPQEATNSAMKVLAL